MKKNAVFAFAAAFAAAAFAGAKETADAAIAKGVAFLKTQQQADGHFSDSNTPALTALPLWALVAAGEAKGPEAAKAAKWVLAAQKPDGGFYTVRPPRKKRPTPLSAPSAPNGRAGKLGTGAGGPGSLSTYNTAVCLSALFESGLAPVRAVLNARTFLAESQILDDSPMTGGFGYGRTQGPRARADLSNTGYAMDAMRRTEKLEEFRAAGEKKADLDWKAALEYVAGMQAEDGEGKGGFVYNQQTPHGGVETNAQGKVQLMAYGAMTYDGILSLCYAKLDRGDPRVKSALEFASKYWSLDENPNRGSAGLYYYYDVLSRALSAARVDELAAPDGRKIVWRDELAAKLASLQRPDGSWRNDDNTHWENNATLATCFAILSLALCR